MLQRLQILLMVAGGLFLVTGLMALTLETTVVSSWLIGLSILLNSGWVILWRHQKDTQKQALAAEKPRQNPPKKRKKKRK